MKIRFDNSALDNAMKSIGAVPAKLGKIRRTRSLSDPFASRLDGIGTIQLSPEEVREHVKDTAGLLVFQAKQVTLHIYHPYHDKADLELIPAPGPKFHLTECVAIKRMMHAGKYDRYIASNEKTGLFPVTHFDKEKRKHLEEMLASLAPCKYCMSQLNYEGWQETRNSYERQNILQNFDLEQFYEDFRFIFRCLPLYTSKNFPDGNYPLDWARISLDLRRQSGWICSCCRLDCVEHHDLLHVHHRSGNKGDCRPSNLKVICAACHKAQPYHNHMQIRPATKNRLEQLRVSQGLPRLCSICGI